MARSEPDFENYLSGIHRQSDFLKILCYPFFPLKASRQAFSSSLRRARSLGFHRQAHLHLFGRQSGHERFFNFNILRIDELPNH